MYHWPYYHCCLIVAVRVLGAIVSSIMIAINHVAGLICRFKPSRTPNSEMEAQTRNQEILQFRQAFDTSLKLSAKLKRMPI